MYYITYIVYAHMRSINHEMHRVGTVKPDPTHQRPIYRQLGMDLSRLAYHLGSQRFHGGAGASHTTKHETSSPHAQSSLGRFRTA